MGGTFPYYQLRSPDSESKKCYQCFLRKSYHRFGGPLPLLKKIKDKIISLIAGEGTEGTHINLSRQNHKRDSPLKCQKY